MTLSEWKKRMMASTIKLGIALAEMSSVEDIKIEPEQLRKNITLLQAILWDVLDIMEDAEQRSSSKNSIAE